MSSGLSSNIVLKVRVQELRLSHQSDLLMVANPLGIGKVPSLHLPLELSESGSLNIDYGGLWRELMNRITCNYSLVKQRAGLVVHLFISGMTYRTYEDFPLLS